ncbi:aspartyl/glutamyl-tRNA(Asn/Gln) amidotransferase subunit B [Clostridia bacterium]|nr:aspartyl/glutamyl-tRNA(Asn/Gln) amidotransferase subunit B [Clostridia bacterium]
MSDYKITIGIECHVQLSTKTKLFSGVDNDAREKEPNSCVSPIDYALPGMLPVLNEKAVEFAVRAGLALNAKINLTSRFDRKHYYYPDLPKGYQITQLYNPIIGEGFVELPSGRKIRIEHAHLEEDAGKLTHCGSYSLVDLNRAGTPLIEIVSLPDIHSPSEARDYCKELWRAVTFAGVSNGDLYNGNMRFDVNISLSNTEKLGTRAEIKNLNSFKSVERAAEYEYKRQKDLLEKGEKITQETRGWSDAKGKTSSQRSKEEAQDYRYMPEPDVPPIVLSSEYVTKIKGNLPLLPQQYRTQLVTAGVEKPTIEILLDYKPLVETLSKIKEKPLIKRIANLFSSVLLAEENASLLNDPLPEVKNLILLAEMAEKGELNSTATKTIFLELFKQNKPPRTLAEELNLLQENDEKALEKLVKEVLEKPECKKAVEDIKNGELKALGFLTGMIMKESRGKANPAAATGIIKKLLL